MDAPMRAAVPLAVLALAILLGPPACPADILVTKTGSRYEGKVTGQHCGEGEACRR